MRRTQLYLDEDQYRWLKRQAGTRGTIAAVVRDLIEQARGTGKGIRKDALTRFLLDESPAKGRRRTSVRSLDEDLYG